MSHLIGLMAVFTYVISAVIALRLRQNFSPISIVLMAFLPPYAIYLLFVDGLDLVQYTATYFFGSMLFLFFWGGLFKSISVRILCDLMDGAGKPLSVKNIYEKYLLTESFKGRLEILIQSNYLVLEDDKTYKLTVVGRKFVQRVKVLQKIYKINASG